MTAPTSAPLLSINNLRKSFGGVAAVSGITFDVRLGQLVALIGTNGAGKTTMFNCINGQLKPDSGTVLYNPAALTTAERIRLDQGEMPTTGILRPRDITGRLPRRIARLGIGRTFQITATFSSMTVRENVQMVLIAQKKLWKRLWGFAGKLFHNEAMALLETVGLSALAEHHTATLAYGDLKRLELAMALANKPKLLLMDEPTAGMGVEERDALMRLVHGIAKNQNIGILFTEHDMDAVFHYADWIIVVHRGEVIARGNAATIQQHPKVREVYLGKDYHHA